MSASEMGRTAGLAADFLKALANRHRLLVLCHLCEGEKSVGALEKLLGVRQPHLSQQLARLRKERLVETRRNSRTIYYRLGSAEAERLIGVLHDMFCAPTRRPGRAWRTARTGARGALTDPTSAARATKRRP
jgi:ArsR family transcriptional regulator, virulence genes transcriptional regulator